MQWTQSLSPAKTSYLLGSMSPLVTPLGRDGSQGDGLLSFCAVACFFGGDVCGLCSSSGHFWLSPGSLFGIEVAGVYLLRGQCHHHPISPWQLPLVGPARGGSCQDLPPCSPDLFQLAHVSPIGTLGIISPLQDGPGLCKMVLVYLVQSGPSRNPTGPLPTLRSWASQVFLASQVDEHHQLGQMVEES